MDASDPDPGPQEREMMMSACGWFRELRPHDYCFQGQRGCSAAPTGVRQTARSSEQCLVLPVGLSSRSVHHHTLKGGIHLLRSQAPWRAVSWNWAVECGSGSRGRESRSPAIGASRALRASRRMGGGGQSPESKSGSGWGRGRGSSMLGRPGSASHGGRFFGSVGGGVMIQER